MDHVIALESAGHDDAYEDSLRFIGNATMLIRVDGFTVLTDPTFVHRHESVPLGNGLHTTRLTDPAVEIEDLPSVDLVLLSHLHGDHFDRVAQERAAGRHGQRRRVRPGRPGPPALHQRRHPPRRRPRRGHPPLPRHRRRGLPPRRHAGARPPRDDGRRAGSWGVRLIDAGTSIPVHYDDYDVFTSSLEDFLEAAQAAGLRDRVLPVARGETVSLAGASLANRGRGPS